MPCSEGGSEGDVCRSDILGPRGQKRCVDRLKMQMFEKASMLNEYEIFITYNA